MLLILRYESIICWYQTNQTLNYRLCLNFYHLLARKPNLEKISIYSNKFFHNFHLSESSFTCPRLRASTKIVNIFSQITSRWQHYYINIKYIIIFCLRTYYINLLFRHVIIFLYNNQQYFYTIQFSYFLPWLWTEIKKKTNHTCIYFCQLIT